MRVYMFLSLWSTLILATNAWKFLVLTPFGSRSVRSVFSNLCQGLLDNEHQVTFVSSGEPFPKHEKLHHVLSPHTALDEIDLFQVRLGLSVFKIWKKAFPEAARQMYQSKEMINIWKQRQSFDGIIINSAANEMAFPFLLNTTAPFITLQPAGIDPLQLAYLGNLISPAALPSIVLPYDNNMNFWERLVNTITMIVMKYSFHRSVGGPLKEALKPIFPDLPDPRSMYPQQALSLYNSHPLMDGAVPLLPTQVEVGCLSCRAAAPVENETLRAFLDEAGTEGVIYFSLGSSLRHTRIPPEYLSILLTAFEQLSDYRILAKLTVEDPTAVPPNVRLGEWLPQQDILGHPSTRLFISHCGKQSMNQASYHGVPILGLPIAFDQPRNCRRLASKQRAVVLQWEQLTPAGVVEAVIHVMNNGSYAENIKRVSRRLVAEKESGMERALRHIEHAVQYREATNTDLLRYSAQNLSLFQYLLLDVFLVLMLTAGVLMVVMVWIVRRLFGLCYYTKRTIAKQD